MDFEADAEVVAVLRSASEGSEEALQRLRQGAGGSYKSQVKQEVGRDIHNMSIFYELIYMNSIKKS